MIFGRGDYHLGRATGGRAGAGDVDGSYWRRWFWVTRWLQMVET